MWVLALSLKPPPDKRLGDQKIRCPRPLDLYLSADVARLYVGTSRQRRGGAPPRLSHREIQVLELWGQGVGTQEIAERLHLSPTTVRTYRHRLSQKLGADNPAELLRAAVLSGLLPGEAMSIPAED